MEAWLIALIVAAAVLLFVILPPVLLSVILYRILLVRTSKEKWGRGCTLPEDPEQVRMFAEGNEWGDRYAGAMTDVTVQSDGYRLAGQYFDFGFRRAALLIAGRMESCRYSCYFAEPYRAAGYNVLVIDNRAHGLSEGRVDCVGYREYRDVLAWCRYLHDEKQNDGVVLHGICIGSATALYAMTAKDCPAYVCAMVADGMFTTFRESFRNHLRERKKPCFPIEQLVMLLVSAASGANAFRDGPLTRIGGMTKPILFLYSKEDIYSLPEKGQELYDACPAPKRLVFFEHGAHSRLRINAQEKYDAAVASFLEDLVHG